jgi:hypothetical protein
MRYSSRFFLYAPVALLLLFAIAVMTWWKISAAAFDARLVAGNGREIMPGVRMSYVSTSMGGFPFRLDSVFDGFALEVQTRTGPLVWRAEHFAVHALTYGPNHQIFEAAGTQELTWTDSEGEHHRYVFVPGSLRASANIIGGRLARFDLDAVAVNGSELSAGRLQFHMRRTPGHDALDVVASGDDVNFYSNLRTGLGDVVRNVTVEGTLAPAVSLQPLLSASADWRAALEDWRHHNGFFSIRDFDLVSDRLKASAHGDLALDGSHRPQGYVNVVLSGTPADDPDAKLARAISRTMASLSHYAVQDWKLRVGLHGGEITVATRLTYPHEQVDASFPAGNIDPLY